MNAVIENLNVIACWNWTGYSRQWVSLYNTRREVVEAVLCNHSSHRRDIRNGERYSVEVLEDEEFTTIRTVYEYDHIGWRTAVINYYTNRPGSIEEKYDAASNDTIYTFVAS